MAPLTAHAAAELGGGADAISPGDRVVNLGGAPAVEVTNCELRSRPPV